MVYTELNITDTTQGMDDILVYASTTVPILIPLILFAIFLIVALATFYGSRKYGQGDFISSAVAGGLTSSAVAIFMTLKPGLVTIFPTVLTVVGITIVFIILLIMTKQREY